MAWINEKASAAQLQQDPSKQARPSGQDGKAGPRKPQARKPQSQQRNPQQKKKPQPPKAQKPPQPSKAQEQQPSDGQPPSNGSTNGETPKPVKGAKPGNQLRPKKKR
jgi:hypothetical protein